MIIYNEHNVWKNQRERELDGTVDQKRKRCCDARSGSRQGWMEEGQELFNDLCPEIDRLQHQPETGKEFEESMKDRFQKESDVCSMVSNNRNSSDS
eukprot:2774484-Ditylum_brightwellii.AAC.1